MTRVLVSTNVRYASGQIAREEAVSVVSRGSGTLVPLYAALTGSAQLANPAQTSSAGNLSFYVESGSYDYLVFGERLPFDAVSDTGQALHHPHHQTTPASVWMVEHNLGLPRDPVILLDSNPTKQVYTDLEHPDVNNTVLIFPSPVTGWAYF